MRYVFWLACIIALTATTQTSRAAGERMPNLSIDRSCREAQDSTGTDPGQTYKNCLADENDARKTLSQKWSGFKPQTRRDCVEAGAVPNPSYVELLTCLEMFNQRLMPSADREITPTKK